MNSDDLDKRALQDYIINIIVKYYIDENKKLKQTIRNLMKEKRGKRK